MDNPTSKFFDKHKAWLDRNKEYLESSDWDTKSIIPKPPSKASIKKDGAGTNTTSKVKTNIASAITDAKKTSIGNDNAIVKNLLGRLTYFMKSTKGEKHLERNKKVTKYILDVIEVFVNRCGAYLDNNLLTDISDQEIRNLEIKFQDLVFSSKINIEDTLDSLGAYVEHEDTVVKFYRDDKSSLILREPLVLLNDDVKLITERIPVDWNIAGSNEMYINMKPRDIPKWNAKKHFFEQELSTIQFWQEELNKITNGFTVGGYFIHPWMYFHLNYFKTPIPQKDGTEPTTQPSLRDNEWFFAENLKACIHPDNPAYYSKAMLVYGTRRFAKSVIMASLAHWKILTKFNASGTIVGGSSSDLGALVGKVKTSMTYMERAFALDVTTQSWENGETFFGIKEDISNAIIYSTLVVQNLQDGAKSKTQKTAGLAPSVSIYDEIGKYAFLKPYLAALPSFKTPYGFKCITVLAGCVCAGTKVYNKEGKIVNIEDLKQEEGIIGYNGDNYSIEEITNLNPPQSKECVRITTEGGDYIECSTDHPFLTTKDNITNKKQALAKRANELEVGDALFMPMEINKFGTRRVKDAKLLGLLIGDGNYNRSVQLACGDPEILDYVSSNYKTTIYKKFTQKTGVQYNLLGISNITKLLRNEGIFGESKYNKRLPDNIHEYDKESVCELLGGYFDADGSVRYRESHNSVRICLTSIVRPLLEEVRMQLYKLGISSSITEEFRKSKSYGNNTQIFRLYINRSHSVKLFYENIKFLCKHKQEALEKVLIKSRGAGTRKGLNGLKFNISPNGKGKFFIGKYFNNLSKKRIISIEPLGKKPIYNLTTSKTHTYLANNFITWNTGGEADLSADAMEVLNNPEAYDLLPMNWDLLESKIDPEQITWKRRRFATFFPGQMAYEEGFIKKPKPFSEFLEIDNEVLAKIDIHLTDWEKNNNFLEAKLVTARAMRSTKGNLLEQQRKVQYPRDPEDCFITLEGNPFPSAEAKTHKEWVIATGQQGRKVTLSKNSKGVIEETPAEYMQEPQFPFPGGFIDSPVILHEPLPETTPPFGLYIVGLDDYKHEQSDGDSVGSFTVYKREWMDKWSLRVVATYASRPNPQTKFHRQGYYLIKAFNGLCFPENEDMNFKTYLDKKHETDVILMKGLDFASQFNLNNNGNRAFGWNPTTKNIAFGLGLLVSYTSEELTITDEHGQEQSILGVQRINDVGILEEIQNFTKDGNFDRLRSFMSALMYAHYLDTIFMVPKQPSAKAEATKHLLKQKNKAHPYSKSSGKPYRK